MKIVVFHPVVLPVRHYGGTERVVMWLVEALSKMGHQIAVFAAPGSSMPEGVECITDRKELIRRAPEFDLIHAFTKADDELIRVFKEKYLVTIGGNGQLGERFHPNTVFVSQNHARRHGASAFVYNGIEINDFKLGPTIRSEHFLFLSKTSWSVKNLGGAIRMVLKYGKNLWVAGGEDPFWWKFCVRFLQFFGRNWKWIGAVDQKAKADFLENGKAMVFPILWNEPFGLVIVESLACGTPVLANPFGSVPELLAFAPQCLMKSEEDWKKAIKGGVELPSAEECRSWVNTHFTKEKMVEKYLQYYEMVKSGKTLNAQEPQTLVTARDISGVAL
jgi:glycosyltransferase involved in cell wall biosynthesis